MQKYQQVSLPPQLQLPPVLTPQQQKQLLPPTLALGETAVGTTCGVKRSFPTPGYLAIKEPASLIYQIQPNNYAYGFNSSGKIVGVNQEVPYPMANAKYHDIPFSRSVDWSTQRVIDGHESNNVSLEKVLKDKELKKKKGLPPAETAEYFTAENDEGYNQWVARKAKQYHEQDVTQAKLRVVPLEIKALPGHVNPSTFETTNETYGQYLDLRPKYPAVYPLPEKVPPTPVQVLVKFSQSNMSDHPLIPNHSFAVDPREMINRDGCYTRGFQGSVYYPEIAGKQHKTAYTFRTSPVSMGSVAERKKNYTFPLYSPTGLELNHPVPRCVSVVAGMDGKRRFRTLVQAKSVPYIYNRYMSYTAPAKNDPETETNPKAVPRKQICAPFNPCPHPIPKCDPCSLEFINPQVLPIPVEQRKMPDCPPTNVVTIS